MAKSLLLLLKEDAAFPVLSIKARPQKLRLLSTHPSSQKVELEQTLPILETGCFLRFFQ